MWVATNQGFFSIVASDKDPKVLMVRARLREDLKRAWGPILKRLGLKIYYSPNRDYAYRCFIPREEVAAEIGKRLLETNYTNFKDSVKGKDTSKLKDLYDAIWYAGVNAQEGEETLRKEAVLWGPDRS